MVPGNGTRLMGDYFSHRNGFTITTAWLLLHSERKEAACGSDQTWLSLPGQHHEPKQPLPSLGYPDPCTELRRCTQAHIDVKKEPHCFLPHCMLFKPAGFRAAVPFKTRHS